MTTEDQTEVVAFLASPETHGGAAVERIDTHASIVFLAATRAWKLKRAVRYDYLNFSTVERRKAMCEAELRLNARTAPGIYRGVTPVTREADGSLALAGQGIPIEWLVEMARFDQGDLLDRRCARGALDLGSMRALASAIADFHRTAERRCDRGGFAAMAWVIDGNAAGFAEEGAGVLDPAACASLAKAARVELDHHHVQLDTRREHGFVRQCHGDLHLRNIVVLDGQPTLFDGIEFNDAIACIDVLYDLSFLLMDLWRRQLFSHANAILNGYIEETSDFDGLSLLPLFMSCRAAVRAKTSATAARLESDPDRRRDLEEMAREYLALAERFLHPAPAALLGVGGLSGSGKSTLARGLAPFVGAAPGALLIRSDVIRKRLCGKAPLERLGPEGYADQMSRRVYRSMLDRVQCAGFSGHAAVADAVFLRRADREALEHIAEDADLPFVGLWLDAPGSQLIDRAERRERDASDADANVVRLQLEEELGTISWNRIDASSTPAAVLQDAMTILAKSRHASAHSPTTE